MLKSLRALHSVAVRLAAGTTAVETETGAAGLSALQVQAPVF